MPQFRGKGLATLLVNMLTHEIIKRGYVPYYSTDGTNVMSMRVAVKTDYIPAWVHTYNTRLEYLIKQ